jgi:hypothetical protein
MRHLAEPVKDGYDKDRYAARATFAHHYKITTSWQDVNRRVNVRGRGFFDELHGQAGVAPNGIEFHPVTRIRFR